MLQNWPGQLQGCCMIKIARQVFLQYLYKLLSCSDARDHNPAL